NSEWSDESLARLQKQFAYTKEEMVKYLTEIVENKKDPIGAMGYDVPIAALNEKDETLFNYFKQLFAQVTNPPIDAYRETVVTSELSYIGCEGNLLKPNENALNRIQLARPVLTEAPPSVSELSNLNVTQLTTVYQYDVETACDELGDNAIQAVKEGKEVIVLDVSYLGNTDGGYAIAILLAVRHIH